MNKFFIIFFLSFQEIQNFPAYHSLFKGNRIFYSVDIDPGTTLFKRVKTGGVAGQKGGWAGAVRNISVRSYLRSN